MKKPEPYTVTLLDYHACRDYSNKKHECDIDDFKGKFVIDKKKKQIVEVKDDTEYQDFWSYLIDATDLSNGSTITIRKEMAENEEKWIQTIVGWFVEEFGDEKDYMVSW